MNSALPITQSALLPKKQHEQTPALQYLRKQLGYLEVFFENLQMNLVFQEQGKLIKQIEDNLTSLDHKSINLILNQELFYHARQELPNHIPNEHTPPSDRQLASKLLKQLPQSSDLDQTVQQIHHRVDIMLNDNFNQLDELKQKFQGQREKIKMSGAKVKQLEELYQEQRQNGVPLNTALSKKMIGYFETSTKDWTLEEVLADLVSGLQQPYFETEQAQANTAIEQQTRLQLQRLLQQFKLTENIFNFEQ